MLDTNRQPALFFAPFVSSTMRIDPAWIDYNGHLNMAYYHVLFDNALGEALLIVPEADRLEFGINDSFRGGPRLRIFCRRVADRFPAHRSSFPCASIRRR